MFVSNLMIVLDAIAALCVHAEEGHAIVRVRVERAEVRHLVAEDHQVAALHGDAIIAGGGQQKGAGAQLLR